MGYSSNCVACMRDPTGNGNVSWRVWFNGRLCSPSWPTRGPAYAYLNALARGVMEPEHEPETQTAAD